MSSSLLITFERIASNTRWKHQSHVLTSFRAFFSCSSSILISIQSHRWLFKHIFVRIISCQYLSLQNKHKTGRNFFFTFSMELKSPLPHSQQCEGKWFKFPFNKSSMKFSLFLCVTVFRRFGIRFRKMIQLTYLVRINLMIEVMRLLCAAFASYHLLNLPVPLQLCFI